jgi:molecular chaperone GrpE
MEEDKGKGAGEELAEDASDPGEEPVVVDDEQAEDEVIRDPNETIAELEERCAAERERFLRAAADLDNFRKRARREVDEGATRGRGEVLGELLPAMDSIDMALASATPDGKAGPVLDGVEMVRKQFLASMARFGLAPVETAPGDVFDPNFHEAVAQIPSEDYDLGVVIEEMRKGYLLGDRLIRAAMVVVSAGPPTEAGEGEAEAAEAADDEPEEAQPDAPQVSETEDSDE